MIIDFLLEGVMQTNTNNDQLLVRLRLSTYSTDCYGRYPASWRRLSFQYLLHVLHVLDLIHRNLQAVKWVSSPQKSQRKAPRKKTRKHLLTNPQAVTLNIKMGLLSPAQQQRRLQRQM